MVWYLGVGQEIQVWYLEDWWGVVVQFGGLGVGVFVLGGEFGLQVELVDQVCGNVWWCCEGGVIGIYCCCLC